MANVAVRLVHERGRVIFEHNGAPFTSQELVALISGGSSKEFESDKTTGRFGTGFLVTHVLAERTDLQGLLALDGVHEMFCLGLNRAGDEKAILENIRTCRESVRAASPVANIDGLASARFIYGVNENDSLALGFDAFRRALPYLYGTRQQLGTVVLEGQDGVAETWTPTGDREYAAEGAWIQERTVRVARTPKPEPVELRVLRVNHEPERLTASVVVLERGAEVWRVKTPDPDLPRVFRDYPVRTATFLPINCILDGKFSVDQERSKVLMDEPDKALFTEALKAAATMVKIGCKEEWEMRHWLTKAAKPATSFDSENVSEKAWWQSALAVFAKDVASLPVVETRNGCIPALRFDPAARRADFVFPRLLSSSPTDETTIERLWPLMDSCCELEPPILALACDWSLLADGWAGLGLQVSRVCVKDLGALVKKKVSRADDLLVKEFPIKWLAGYIDVVGECWQRRKGVDETVLDGLLPNQNGMLCTGSSLRRDAGVSKEIKDICSEIGLDLRAVLLTKELACDRNQTQQLATTEPADETNQFQYLVTTLAKAVPHEASEDFATEQCIARLDHLLPMDGKFVEKQRSGLGGSIKLISHLHQTRRENGETYCKRLPLLTKDLSVVRWSKERMLMSPPVKWNTAAQRFSNAYPESRLLAAEYAGDSAAGLGDVVAALVTWGICFADPFTTVKVDLKDRRLLTLAVNSGAADGVTVFGEESAQIALLQPEVLNHCQEGPEEARSLLGLAVCYMATRDRSWRTVRRVKGRKEREDIELDIRGALWIADLCIRAWVPVEGDDGKFTKAVANHATLQCLIDSSWLPGNDDGIALLSDWFGFDELELRLLGTAPGDAERQRLRDGLAKVVEKAGADPATYEEIARQLEEREKRARDVKRCQKIGIAIQEAVRAALEARGLKLTLIDRGFDYRVDVPTDDMLADEGFRFSVGTYMLEVKATTCGDARLTPLQAETASSDSENYVLCVVDLRGVTSERLDGDWTGDDVEAMAKIVVGIGKQIKETCVLVDMAKTQAVGIRNESALRYVASTAVWGAGSSIAEWVSKIAEGRAVGG
jgi:hypothetical protein